MLFGTLPLRSRKNTAEAMVAGPSRAGSKYWVDAQLEIVNF